MRKHRRILVVRTDRVGDVVLATPLIRALRKSFPDAHIAALVRPYTRDVLLHNPHLDEVLIDDPEGAHAGRAGYWHQVHMLRSRRFDTALLLLPTERMAWMLFFAGIRTRVGVGLKLYEALTLMRTVSRHKYNPLRHEAEYCLDLGRKIGARDDGLDVEVVATEEERTAARAMLNANGWDHEREILIGIHPGSGRSSPNWKIERYAELAMLLARRPGTRLVLTGAPHEKRFSTHFETLPHGTLVDLVGRLSLRQLVGVISQLRLLISASTGPMHIAAGLKVPTLSMFCPLTACSPKLWGPLGNRSEVILPPAAYCSTRCPGDPHICEFEGGISPADAYGAAVTFLPSTMNPQP